MTLRAYRITETLLLAVVAASVALAMVQGYAWLPAPIIIAAIIVGMMLRRRVKEFAVDERVTNIAEKSLALAAGVFIVIAAPTGITLLALGREVSPEIKAVGWTLALAGAVVVLIYSAAYIYYNSRYSG
jgi:uncharacterized membrane protein